MKHLIGLVVFLIFMVAAGLASAQVTQCNGPSDMCSEITDLQRQLAAQKDATAKAVLNQNQAMASAEKDHQMKMAKMVSISAFLAVALKILISVMKGWVGFLKTDKGKAAIKSILLVFGFAAFILTNLGMGMPLYQALIIAGGPPGAILVHELMDLVPVLQGKKKLAPDQADA